MTSTQAMPQLDIYLRKKIEILSRIIWSYDSSGVQAKKYFGSMYEPIIYGVKNKNQYTFNADQILIEAVTGSKRKLIDYRKTVPTVYNSQKVPGNVWSFPRVRYRMEEYEEHPTQKPTALLERIILASSNPGDVVLDPFAGSFTTNYVAQSLKRRSIGIELNSEYVGIGLRRLSLATELDGKELKKAKKIYDKVEPDSDNLLNLDLQ
jgi:site-specific DNA-methyltransferase (adenine-specific)